MSASQRTQTDTPNPLLGGTRGSASAVNCCTEVMRKSMSFSPSLSFQLMRVGFQLAWIFSFPYLPTGLCIRCGGTVLQKLFNDPSQLHKPIPYNGVLSMYLHVFNSEAEPIRDIYRHYPQPCVGIVYCSSNLLGGFLTFISIVLNTGGGPKNSLEIPLSLKLFPVLCL